MVATQGHPHLRVGLAQFKPKKADLEFNLSGIRRVITEQLDAVDILVFSEANLSGYFLEGGVAEVAVSVDEVAKGLGSTAPGSPDVVIGFYERHRRRLYNSVAYFTPEPDGFRTVHVHRKIFLPTYGVFDEARFVEAGTEVRAFDSRFGRVGLLICEEMWHSFTSTILALGGAELIIAVSASPARDFTPDGGGRPKNLSRWDALAPAAAVEHGLFVAVSQLVGSEGGKVFPGGSMAVGPDGMVLAEAPLFEDGVTVASLDFTAIERIKSPLLADLERVLPKLEHSLQMAVRSKESDGEGEE
ncbi:uncharacterized protein METZ01_LOCUS161367, partial [marine metagenome]